MSNISQLSNLGLFDARVPRYTSYPTAPHFSDAVGSASARGWIQEIPANSKISLYIHVPFCRRLCWFCACRTQGTSTLAPVEAYVQTLKTELALVATYLPDGVELEHLHWGGGTPTLLSPDLISDLSHAIFQVAPLSSGAQFSVEIDPNEIDDARLDALSAAGMNRASIGVQDFDPRIQETIGREQSYETTKAAIDALRARDISSLNMDILYGLPHQNKARITDSVQKVVALSPDRIALYGYAHVPWMAKRQALIPTDVLPTPQERLGLFETARDLFVADGYREIGIDHFARPGDGLATALDAGKLRRNFQGYTEDTSRVLIGVGASAISRYPGGYAQNAPSTSAYQAAIRSGNLATSRGHHFSADDLIRARLIETLLCDFRIDIPALADDLATSPDKLRLLCAAMLQSFPGMFAVSPEVLEILHKARPLARMMARQLDAYEVSESGHSHAV